MPLTSRFTPPSPRKENRYTFYRKLVGPRPGMDGCEKARPYHDSIPDRPARSESLYRLSYPGPAKTRTHLYVTHKHVQTYPN